MRATVIFDNLGPYHQARLRAGASVSTLTAIQVSARSADYAWESEGQADGFNLVTLFPEKTSREAPASQVVRRMRAALIESRPEVVFVPGWSSCAALAALEWCSRHKVAAVIMSESTAWDEKRVEWKENIKRRIVTLCSAAMVGGQPQAEYAVRLGLAPDHVVCGYDAVDNDYFSRRTEEVRRRGAELRSRYGLPANYFLASARFVEKKNLPRLLQAYANYRAGYGKQGGKTREAGRPVPWSLVLLGDGPLRDDLLAQISKLNLQGHVFMPGFKQYPDLPIYYGLAGAFIHASTTEQWGLVINEAMASSLPVLVSNRCGCATDLVEEGKNGFTFDPYYVKGLTLLMTKISAPDFPLAEFGSMSRKIIDRWGPGQFATALEQTARLALAAPLPSLAPSSRVLLALLTRKPMAYDQTSSGWPDPPQAKALDKEAVEQFFTLTAGDYSKLFLARRSGSNFVFRERLELAEQMTSGLSGRFLDCGCGTGEITAAILRSGHFPSAIIVDLSPTMLQITQQRMEEELKEVKMDRLEFVSSDIFDFVSQSQSGPYDLILCLGLIAHTGRLSFLLAKLKAHLAPTGAILLQSSLLDHVGTRVVRAMSQERYYRKHGYRISYYSHEDILRSAKSAGLEAVEVRRSTFGFPFGDRVSAQLNYHLEKKMRNWATQHGAEAMYLLKPSPHEH